tara:strand:- start:634 stop:1296 length:663 start_codon:yes stop_codon:yes gene_type:complete
MKVLFFCSGNGGNMKFLHLVSKLDGIGTELKGIEIIGIIADRDCGALEYAKRESMFSCLHSFDRTEREDFKLIKLINSLNPDLIVTNVHKVISKRVLDAFDGQILNVHYSILPAFAGSIGMKTVDNAIKERCRFLGSTCHVVTTDLDGGPILSQSVFPYNGQENVYNSVFRTGALALLSGVLQMKIEMKNVHQLNEIQTNPLINIDNSVLKKVFDELSSK